jgi:glyoxylase I family protein
MVAILTNPHLDIGLVSADIAGPTRFYHEVLGFPLAGSIDIPGVGQVARFQVGNSILRVLVPVAAPARSEAKGGFSGTVGIRYLALKIGNLAETVDRVAAAGFVIAVPIRTLRPGVLVALVEDADGNTVELMEDAAS